MIPHYEYLDRLENQVAEMENTVVSGRGKTDLIKHMMSIRKHLLTVKRCYTQLLEVTEPLCLNEGGFFEEKIIPYLKLFEAKINRFCGRVSELQEYVTNIRDAYQAQVDISLNQTMKLFTVVTAVFLPLTLIAGWYGMNFDMPEYHWAWGYPAVVLLNISPS